MAVGAIWGTVIMMTATNAYYAAKQNGGNMSKLKVVKPYKFKTKEEARAFIRQVMGPPYTELSGKEYDEVSLMLALLEPYEQTNNQHSWTDCYKIGDIEYRVTSWPGDHPPTIAEYLPEKD